MPSKIEFKTEKRKISDLKGCDYNPRQLTKKQYNDLKKSISKFNYVEIVVINTDNTIVAGHQRLRILGELKGLDHEIEVRVPNRELTKEEFDEYLIRSNKNTGEWDWDILANDFEIDDLKDWGFEDSEFGFGFEDEEEETEGDDETPEPPEEPITVKGDLYELGNHRLLCGDSTVITDVDKLMDGKKADMVFTDPPYGVDYDGINNDDREGLENLLRGSFGNYLSTSKSGAGIYVFHSDKCADIFHIVFREFFHFSSMIIWSKNSLTLSRTDYQSQHEPCLYGWMKGESHSFYGDRKQVSVWKFDKERVEGHTTPKPVELIVRALENSSKVGDIVTDLFGGSGSTLIACEKTNRDCRMMELDPKYCDVIVKRYIDFCMTNNRPFSVKRNGKDIGEFK